MIRLNWLNRYQFQSKWVLVLGMTAILCGSVGKAETVNLEFWSKDVVQVDTWAGSEEGLPFGGLKAFFPGASAKEFLHAYFNTNPGEMMPGATVSSINKLSLDVARPGGARRVLKDLRVLPGTPAGDTQQTVEYFGNGRGRILVDMLSGPLKNSQFNVSVWEGEGVLEIKGKRYRVKGTYGEWSLKGIRPWTNKGPFKPLYDLMHAPSQLMSELGKRAGRLLSLFPPAAFAVNAATAAPEFVWNLGSSEVSTLLSRLLTARTQTGPPAVSVTMDRIRSCPIVLGGEELTNDSVLKDTLKSTL